jgi:hypothetical protein
MCEDGSLDEGGFLRGENLCVLCLLKFEISPSLSAFGGIQNLKLNNPKSPIENLKWECSPI